MCCHWHGRPQSVRSHGFLMMGDHCNDLVAGLVDQDAIIGVRDVDIGGNFKSSMMLGP